MDRNPAPIESMPRQERRSWWATMFVLCGLLGAMLGLSVKTETIRQHQDVLAQQQGGEVLIKANTDLQRRIAQLQHDNDQLVKSVPTDSRRLRVLSADLEKAQFQAGLTDVKGPGIIVTLNDSKVAFPGGLPPGMTPPNIIHDTDINQVTNELKAAGAEAISVNDQRLVAVSPIRCAGPTIFVNNTPQTPPYVITAIGNPKILATALNISGGIAEQIRHYDPAMLKIEKANKPVVIPAYSGGIEPRYASPVSTSLVATDRKTGT